MSYRTRSSRPTSLYSSSPNFGGIGASGYGSLSQSTPYLNNLTPSSSPSYSSYGGTLSGYGSLTLPSSSSSLHNLSPSSSVYSSLLSPGLSSSSRSNSPTPYARVPYNTKIRSPASARLSSRVNSLKQSYARSTRRPDPPSSKSSSTKSLASEGYESGGEQSEVSSRLNSVSVEDDAKPEAAENGEIDYKKLYEESQRDNERLRQKLRIVEADLAESRVLAESNTSQTRNSLTESEKRERRALERKLSEMEEELKQLQKLKSDNERLRAENRALTRVVSKLTASQNK